MFSAQMLPPVIPRTQVRKKQIFSARKAEKEAEKEKVKKRPAAKKQRMQGGRAGDRECEEAKKETEKFGCSKCRRNPNGCAVCHPARFAWKFSA